MGQPLPFVTQFVDELDHSLKQLDPDGGLSRVQKGWLSFCLLAIVVTNSVCWKRFERASLGQRSHASLSWLFRQNHGFWEFLLRASVSVIVAKYGITQGVLVVDDTDKKRSKRTKRLHKVHKMKDKSSGGFIQGQCLVFLLLVTDTLTLPVGVEFFMPDPTLTVWHREDKRLRKQGVPKKQRPDKPVRNPNYPTKPTIALELLQDFHRCFPKIQIRCVLADTLYGTQTFLDDASSVFGGVQVISKLRKDQKVRLRGKTLNLTTFSKRYPGLVESLSLRGGQTRTVYLRSARLYVEAHGKKRFVIALKYEGEEEYRYLVASDMSWRTRDIAQAQTLRWLVEVFIQDWKAYEGWGQSTKQTDEEGSRRSLSLSLLCDHCLLVHPAQLARIEDKLPACTVGSLRASVQSESLIEFLAEVVLADDPVEELARVTSQAQEVFRLNDSSKHMVGRDLGRLESTPGLEHRVRNMLLKAA